MIIFTETGEINKEVNSIKELIDVFDLSQMKPLSIHFIGYNIKNWGQDNQERTKEQDYIYENLAFSLFENLNTDVWGTRFGPEHHMKSGDQEFIQPQFEDITPEAIAYWESRIDEVKHPALKLQYSGLVHTFKERITGQQCCEAFLRDYFDAIINASENGYERPLDSVQKHLPVAFEIAKTYTDLLPRIKAEYLRITNSTPLPHVGEWLAYFDLLLNNIREKRLFSPHEKQDLVNIIEKRLSALISLDPNATGEAKLDPFRVKDVAEKLATYYKQTNDVNNKERVISYIEVSFRKFLTQGTPLQQLAWLREVQQCYFKFDMNARAQALYGDIQNASLNVPDSLQSHEVSVQIPPEIINELIADIIHGAEDDVYHNFVQIMMPKHKDAKAFVDKQSSNQFGGLIRTQILSEDGFPLSLIDDEIGNEYYFCAKFIEHEEPIMRMVVKALQDHQFFTRDKIVNHIMRSNLIKKDRQTVIEKGVQLYLDGDAVTACHLLIPQIEHAICMLAVKKNAQALRRQREGKGYTLQLMDKLFDVKEIKEALGDDVVFYLRALLTEQRGLNLRNDLCHGLINPLYFDINKADRIIHVLLLLGGLNVETLDS